MGSERARQNFKEIFTMYAEVIFLSGSLNYFSKSLSGRVRPYTYNPDVSMETKLRRTTSRSFYSGHAAHLLSLSFFTARMFSEFSPDSKYKYMVWTGLLSFLQ